MELVMWLSLEVRVRVRVGEWVNILAAHTINQSINLYCHLQKCSQPMRAYETLLSGDT